MDKVLIFADYYLPGYRSGGPVRSLSNLVQVLNNKFEVYLITRNHDAHCQDTPYKEPTHTWIERDGIKVMYLEQGIKKQVKQVLKVLSSKNFSVIHVNSLFSSIFSIVPLFYHFKSLRAKHFIISPRGELAEAALGQKLYKKLPYITLLKQLLKQKKVIWHSTSDYETERMKKFFETPNVIQVTNLPTQIQPEFVSIKKEANHLRLVTTSRIAKIKNFDYILKLLASISGKVTFHIYGIRDELDYQKKCEELISKLPSNVECKILPSVEHHKIHELIQKYHFYISSTEGENFGHAIFEGFLVGRPILLSNTTPWLKLEYQNIGWDLPLSEPERWKKTLKKMVEMEDLEFQQLCKHSYQFAENFISDPQNKQGYFSLYQLEE